MGLETVEALRSFCLELSNEKPSPGGGSAAAAAGAMAASLLVMVCEITSRKKKHENAWSELRKIKSDLEVLRDELVGLSLEDARAYDLVVDAARVRKATPGGTSERIFQSALKHASEVPQKTALACSRVLELAVKVAGIGTMRAASDVGVATLLADAGLKGAGMNVRINLGDLSDGVFAESARGKLQLQEKRARGMVDRVLDELARGDSR